MSKEFNVLLVAFEGIKNDNLEQLDKALRIMPLEKLKDEHETLLSNLLATCASFHRTEASKMILERWKVIYPENDKISMFARLFMKKIINTPTLSFLASVHPEITFVELIDQFCEWDSSENVIIACERADLIYGEQKYDTYVMLRDRAVSLDNFRVEEFMIDKISKIAPFAKKPEYVKNYLVEYLDKYKERLPTEEELGKLAEKESKLDEIELPSNEEAVKLLTEGLESLGIEIGEINSAKQFLMEEISRSEDRKRELLLPILKNEQELAFETDRLLFWIYGPSNPLVSQDLTLNTPSAKYGGCRMFLCDLFDYNEEYDYVEDWFTGSCDECLLRIEKRCYAVRQPRPHGGWEGVFCSWKCVRERVKFIEGEEMKPDLLTHTLINAYEKKTKEIGIQDREN